ncbi:NADH:flavin oxidoreductase [Desulfonema ishimotonii]|uniref:NADH:flavin oxidoreductase n=2 Tax=Desulfonema ishimotonii TaxID=45657 RepID=A0A401FUE6_9BACT|nr:NADH:flavin oxidoreductase [Desulfonema ishimotonii]
MLLDHYARLGRCGAAMVVVANVAVSEDGITSLHNLRADHDDFIPGLARLAQAIRQGGAVTCLQLNHAGRYARTERPLLPSPIDSAHLTFDIASFRELINFFPFENRFRMTRKTVRRILSWRQGMSGADKDRIIRQFGQAAARAAEAGFDMVELHGATGYLLTQFLSPYTHKTPDGEPLSFEARIAFPLAVVREVRRRLPPGFPVGFRLLLREWVPEGIDLSEALKWAKILETEGIAWLSATSGTYGSMFSPKVRKITARSAYLREDTAALTRAVNVPAVISGRILTPVLGARLIREKAADLIGLGRPLVADIRWIEKARSGRKVRTCINCYGCLRAVASEQGLYCRRWPVWASERVELEQRLLDRHPGKMLCVISGPDDAARLTQALPVFIAPRNGFSLTLLFLKSGAERPCLSDTESHFVRRTETIWGDRLTCDIGRIEKRSDQTIGAAVESGGFGTIFMVRKPGASWQKRFIYRQQGRIIGLIGDDTRLRNMLVSLDLSVTSLLVMRYLSRFRDNAADVTPHYAHILTGPAEMARHRWEKMKKITKWDDRLPLTLVPSSGDVAADILKVVRDGGYGTLVMGKRGFTGLKRWLMGSVSAKVMQGLEHQTLFVVD